MLTKFAPANNTNKPPNAGPIIPAMLDCKLLEVAAEGNSMSEKAWRMIDAQAGELSWATTQVPEITAAIQSSLNAGFRSAAQVEFAVMIGE